jgi:uncharacterized protein YqgV (UPF0045/DUF77 family)
MELAKRCHQAMRGKTERVITLIKIDNYEQRTGRLVAAVKSVEDKVGKSVKK